MDGYLVIYLFYNVVAEVICLAVLFWLAWQISSFHIAILACQKAGVAESMEYSVHNHLCEIVLIGLPAYSSYLDGYE